MLCMIIPSSTVLERVVTGKWMLPLLVELVKSEFFGFVECQYFIWDNNMWVMNTSEEIRIANPSFVPTWWLSDTLCLVVSTSSWWSYRRCGRILFSVCSVWYCLTIKICSLVCIGLYHSRWHWIESIFPQIPTTTLPLAATSTLVNQLRAFILAICAFFCTMKVNDGEWKHCILLHMNFLSRLEWLLVRPMQSFHRLEIHDECFDLPILSAHQKNPTFLSLSAVLTFGLCGAKLYALSFCAGHLWITL